MIGIIGATGEIGGKTFDFLKTKTDLCLLVRRIGSVKHLLSPHIHAREFDFGNLNKIVFERIHSLLWILPNNHSQIHLQEQTWLEIAKYTGVKYIVKLSAMRAEKDDIFHHRNSELNIIHSGIAYTFLRPNTFMQNFNNYEIDDIKDKRQLRFPANNGKTSFVDSRDVAEVAATILLDPKKHLNQAYTLTGSEALSYGAAANLFSQVLPFSVEYIDITQSSSSDDQYKINHLFYAAIKRGEFAHISSSVKNILGKSPKTLLEYITNYQAYFHK